MAKGKGGFSFEVLILAMNRLRDGKLDADSSRPAFDELCEKGLATKFVSNGNVTYSSTISGEIVMGKR